MIGWWTAVRVFGVHFVHFKQNGCCNAVMEIFYISEIAAKADFQMEKYPFSNAVISSQYYCFPSIINHIVVFSYMEKYD